MIEIEEIWDDEQNIPTREGKWMLFDHHTDQEEILSWVDEFIKPFGLEVAIIKCHGNFAEFSITEKK